MVNKYCELVMAIGYHQHPGHRRFEAELSTNLVFFCKFVLRFTKLTSMFIYFYQPNLRGLYKSIGSIDWLTLIPNPRNYCCDWVLIVRGNQKIFDFGSADRLLQQWWRFSVGEAHGNN